MSMTTVVYCADVYGVTQEARTKTYKRQKNAERYMEKWVAKKEYYFCKYFIHDKNEWYCFYRL